MMKELYTLECDVLWDTSVCTLEHDDIDLLSDSREMHNCFSHEND